MAYKRFQIKVAVGGKDSHLRDPYSLSKPKTWHQIGHATQTSSGPKGQPMLLCRMYSVPLNWTGEFVLFESEYQENDPPPKQGDY